MRRGQTKDSQRSKAILESFEVRRLLSAVVVNTLDDETTANATTSLREAIAMAAAGDTIQFKSGLTGTILLGSAGELVVNKNVAIAGPGAAKLAVSGNNATRVMRIGAGAAVSVSGITIRNGLGVNEGGGIHNAGALTLDNCVVTDNVVRGAGGTASSPPGRNGNGGGVWSGGALVLMNSTLSGNSATGGNGLDASFTSIAPGGAAHGGAVFSAGTLTVSNVAFANNTATGGAAGYSGAMEWTPGSDAEGGALYLSGAAGVAIGQSTFSNNSATGGVSFGASYGGQRTTGGAARGGAIRVAAGAGNLTLTGTTFSRNKATAGRGYSDGPSGPGGAAYGGAIDAAGGGAVTATGGTFTFNTATGGEGGGSNSVDANPGGDARGGAIHGSAALALNGVAFEGNIATGGAGGYWEARIGGGSGRDLGGNAAGGAVAGFANVSATRSTFLNSTAIGGASGGNASGGAIDAGVITLTESTLIGSYANGRYADGVVFTDGDVDPRVTIVGGEARGGAVHASGALTITGSTLTMNYAWGGSGEDAEEWMYANAGGDALGGAIYAAGGGAITRSTLTTNGAHGGEGGDGAVGVDETGEGPPELQAGNGGDARGGAVYQAGTSALTLTACTVADNQAVGGPSGTPITGGTPTTDGAETGGGVAGSGVKFANTLVATNSAGTGPDVSGTAASQGFNLIGKSNGSSGWVASDKTGTIASPLDPKLGLLASNGGPTKTMALFADSPALDAGKAFGLTTDQRNAKRPVNLASVANAAGGDGSDIGAFELQGLAPLQTPFKAFVIGPAAPLTLQAEDFDNGGEGIAYHDLDLDNRGGAYRTTAVDVQPTTDSGGGYNVGWAKAGEWLEYTVDVEKTGAYDLAFRVASNGIGGRFTLGVDGDVVTGTKAVPNTGGWQNWHTVVSPGVNLTAGKHVLRLAMHENGATGFVGNFNYLTVTAKPAGVITVITDTAAHVRDGSYRFANYGSSPTLEVKKSTTNYSRETYLKFVIPPETSLAPVASAKLRLYGAMVDAASPAVEVGVYTSRKVDWSETALTWLNRPLTEPASVATAIISGTAKQWYEIDLTQFVNAELAAGRTRVTLVLRSNTSSTALAAFNSDEAASNRPELIISS